MAYYVVRIDVQVRAEPSPARCNESRHSSTRAGAARCSDRVSEELKVGQTRSERCKPLRGPCALELLRGRACFGSRLTPNCSVRTTTVLCDTPKRVLRLWQRPLLLGGSQVRSERTNGHATRYGPPMDAAGPERAPRSGGSGQTTTVCLRGD